MVNTAWAFAKMSVWHEPLFAAIAAGASGSRELSPQDLTSLAWSYAALLLKDSPFLDFIAQTSERAICEFGPQHLSLSAWAFAVLALRHEPLLDAIAMQAMQRMAEFGAAAGSNFADVGPCQDLALTAWAFATLAVCNYPLMASLSIRSQNTVA